MDFSKVQAMLDWPQPRTLIDLRDFLGLTGCYKKFVQEYGQIAGPLIEQLKKGCYLWNEEACTTFQRLKTAMTQVPVLAMPDFSKPFVIEADALGFAVGAVLMQDDKLVAFHSQVLGLRARKKSSYEKELMAIVFAVLKWRSYLLRRKFFVRIDQESLKFLFEQGEIGPEYQKWVCKLLGYDFEIHYKAGQLNRACWPVEPRCQCSLPPTRLGRVRLLVNSSMAGLGQAAG